MRTLDFPAELIRDYYYNDFGIDLRRYFYIMPMVNHRDIAFISNLDWQHNHDRKCSGSPACRYSLADYRNTRWEDFRDVTNETEKNFIFAGIFYFLVLVPQTLREMFGQEVEYDFYRCTGWPLISGGLGGYLAPEQMLKEALLYPCDMEHENFGRMLSGIVPFMNDEVQRFFRKQESMNINHQAYLRMLAGTRDRIDEFLMIINERTEDFRDSFLTSVELL